VKGIDPTSLTPDDADFAVTVTDLDDPTSAGADIELIDLDAVQLGAVPFRARRVVVRLEGASVLFHSTNVRVRTHTSVSSGLIAYVTFGPHANGTVNGLPVRPGMVLAAEPGTEARFVVETGWESITVLLPPQEISEHLTARQRESEFRLPRGVEPLRVSVESGRALFNFGERLVALAARQPDLFNEQRQERIAARVELLETLLATLGGAVDLEPAGDERTRSAQSLVVKTVESYALSRIDEQLHVSDLCRAAGVSERTLEYAFREIMGLTPVTYLIRLRLHQVRRALLAATQGSTTVSAVALDWGFWHFGEFSRAYRECFGELPSDTLRRVPAAPGGRQSASPGQ
jgi:AraC family transcriptional regulator, ethanolamine operon transcriptional activator